MYDVGFEPTRITTKQLKCFALDHLANRTDCNRELASATIYIFGGFFKFFSYI